MRLPPTIHAVPITGSPRARDHRATATCWCQPTEAMRDLATGAVVFVHRDPEPASRQLPSPVAPLGQGGE
jgi:hypothetical protein